MLILGCVIAFANDEQHVSCHLGLIVDGSCYLGDGTGSRERCLTNGLLSNKSA